MRSAWTSASSPACTGCSAEVGRTLDVDELPEMFVRNNPITNAMTIGMDKPIIVLNSALLDLLDEEEMRFVVAHELGHALSGHAVYRTLLLRLLNLAGVWSAVPGGALGFRAIVAALFEWQRKSELSADRAGLLATQDPATAFRVHMKLASGSGDLSELDQTSFFAQGQEYLDAGDLRDSVLKLLLVETDHPPVRRRARGRAAPLGRLRASTPRSWPAPTRAATRTTRRKVSDAAKQAADSYTETFRQTQDALGKLVHDVAGFFGSAKLWLDEQLRRNRD